MNILKLIFCVGIIWCLLACSSSNDNTSLKAAYLVPQLQSEQVLGFELFSAEGYSKLALKDGRWWVAEPIDFIADASVVEAFLKSLTDAKIGKKLHVAPSDYHLLGVDKAGGIRADIQLTNGESVTLVFGNLDMPRDSSDSAMLGVAAVARRFIRVIDDTDDVYLAPISLIDLSSYPSLWTNTAFMRSPSFKRLQLRSNEAEPLDVYRSHRFGPLFKVNETGKEKEFDPNRFSCFESFLKSGHCLQVSKADEKIERYHQNKELTVTIEDFTGLVFRYRFARPVDPSAIEVERQALQADFLNDGIAQKKVPFTVELIGMNNAVDLNYFEQQLKQQNIELATLYADRVAFIDIEHYLCLVGNTAELGL
ncbi:DUF4340 domain-containing protein [Saccharophagus degradans]|uniref:DUF4340 domain-containing protein n=1 Tax=Saccharophagus degradans TaxID=86304 RepID=A0AAW7XEA5_9GAMM|nr:DUF4340 domain-containing protein [Saccharophagus degradans]MBU2986636.1 DUF4340 domain-containing protein [Saccharophagus degradans]MDO6424752.1 DUF4340 domain-containing protein [Saccharophagus degradans]MDO6609496.1 DUF4340 domain-containing protein [Saccharophagus degradans]